MSTGADPFGLALGLAAAALVTAASIGAAIRLWKHQQQAMAAPPVAVGSTLVVPVGWIIARAGVFGLMRRDSLRPRLALTPEGVHYRALRESFWAWHEVQRVDASRTGRGVRLRFVGRTPQCFVEAGIADGTVAARVLQAVPQRVPLTTEAAAFLRPATEPVG